MNYKKLNNLTGWIVWLVATLVYLLTIEPTASFWDCGEFIATAFKLEVGHPPGAPVFMLIGRIFTLFAGPESAAVMVNILSGLCSSFTILFLFWTITALAKKLAEASGELTRSKIIAVLGSGVVGGLAYTFSDSFWFSAVEGEVYAMSSLFTALVFWAIVKWEAVAHEKYNERWLVLIAFLMGLSIGVHLLNLLAIPAITFVYYFKKYNPSRKGILITSAVSILILGFIQYGIIPGAVKMAALFERLFVNSFGMPFNSGLYVYAIVAIAVMAYAIYYTHTKQKALLNIVVMCLTVIMIGYSAFSIILIRSSANPPMDENNPENVFNLLSYLNREQYGDRPLFFGQYFNTPLDRQEPYKDGSPVYFQDKQSGKYIISDDKKSSEPNYNKELSTVFPRMWSSQSNHIQEYKIWSDFKGKPVTVIGSSGKPETIYKPTFGENLTFFFKYQIGHMYWRYFMWNFVGRQNDEQGHGEINKGNWVSGIKFIDAIRLGQQEKLPKSITENPANNTFFFLPLLLGLAGMFFQWDKNKKDFTIVMLLFFFTGIAIVIYLNQYPLQPRERDYAFASSFYAFAIWIGLGVYALYDYIKRKSPENVAAIVATLASLLLVPGIMAKEGWDDHSRAKRYTARDFAKNYLASCDKNAILFTNGDNDTFPLWYVQEVEGYRTDVRVINLSLLNTDWYVTQMKRKAYDSDPVPFSLPEPKYRQGTNDYLPIFDKGIQGNVDVTEIIKFVESENPNSKIQISNEKYVDFIPTKNFKVKVDKAKFENAPFLLPSDTSGILDKVEWSISKNYIFKNDLMILDLLATNNWNRPVYFAITTGNEAYLGLQEHFQLEGLAYRLIPVKTGKQDGQTGRVNTQIMYDNLMNKFEWGGLDKHTLYMDENNRRMCMNFRNNFARLAEALITEGDKEKAKQVLDRCMEVIPERNVPFDYFVLPIAEAYYKVGEGKSADDIIVKVADVYEDELNYLNSLKPQHAKAVENEKRQAMAVIQRLMYIVNEQHKDDEFGAQFKKRFELVNQEIMRNMMGG
ncbi:MAG: DUF2723 domain-containing protein [Bacteroidetes bacterium]|nr:DUF2723 domain-containing protein [Bacteroidota bacterium]NOG94527.1 DUF2723 domain-containing protein [Bacteroidota bacterium]